MKKSTLLSITLFIGITVTYGQQTIAVKKLDKAGIPKAVTYVGQVKSAIQWKDMAGNHVVVLAEKGPYQNPKYKHEEDGSDGELYAYHYLLIDTAALIWKLYDYVRDCPLDMEAEFIQNSLSVTDLDKDGVGEIWFLYRIACHGDVSPAELKLFLYQGRQKYAMRGQTKVRISEKETIGGDYQFDAAFHAAPKVFRDYAQMLWKKFVQQSE
ncbi:MAG TPA: hypothetical protein VHK91_15890 [Flavisolibacter sp.]|jgi:hypothetical protein|nr:hypothetical protein [Flavisolibacter sp.]